MLLVHPSRHTAVVELDALNVSELGISEVRTKVVRIARRVERIWSVSCYRRYPSYFHPISKYLAQSMLVRHR